ncbi:MAG: hypothetical protein WC878_08060 [Candidatus Paceibacterota bacterium]|jgi:hypothetical protein
MRKKFHYITFYTGLSEEQDQAIPYLEKACEEAGIQMVVHDSEHEILDATTSSPGDMVYRAATTNRGRMIERLLVSPEIAHFYDDWRQASNPRGASYFIHKRLGLPIIPTYPTLPVHGKETEECLRETGPFPVIIKVRGGTHGVGVIRADSAESFATTRDYLRANKINAFVRAYIPHEYYVRAIVLGNNVLIAHASHIVPGDFRTNADHITEQTRRTYVPDPEMEKMIIKAVRSLGLSFGGVDLLIDSNGKPFIAEVNFPCQFFVTQEVTGFNIAREMVLFLKQRSENLSSGK